MPPSETMEARFVRSAVVVAPYEAECAARV